MINQDGFMNDIWELYGLSENPFSTSPILVRGGSLKPDCFVGRESQLKHLGKILSSKGGSRTLIYGDVGVGKTTFVNVLRIHAEEKNYFTPFKEIAVQDNWNAEDFIVNTLASFYATLRLMKTKPLSDSTYKKLECIFGIGNKDYDGGIQILGCGINLGKSTKENNNLSIFNLNEIFTDLINEINENKKEIIIHYNNLELISESSLKRIFENLRDFFQIRGVHFVFVGNLTVHSNFQSIPRFSSTLTDSILIETLTFEEIKDIIKKRFESLRISKELQYIIPYDDESIKSLFELWGGNIRNILNSLSTAVLEITKERPITLDKNLLAITLKNTLEKKYLSKLQPKGRLVLIEMAKHNEITNKSLSNKMKIARPNISTYLKELCNEGCIYLRRKEGRDKYWCTEPKVKWILLK